MAGWKKILCPVDFSECSRWALLEAAELARRHGGQMFLVHILEEPWPVARGIMLAPPELMRNVAEGAQRDLAAWKAAAEEIAPGQVVAEMVSGHPADGIVRLAREGAYDLVVIGTHGRRGLRRFLVGSIASEVAKAAPCTVLLVRPKQTEFDVKPD
jgi:universal stress protein A